MAETQPVPKIDAVVAVDPVLIDKSVEFINNAISKTLYKGSLEIGKYLFEHFYNNDSKLAFSKNPHKPVSFQTLCNRDDLGVHPSTLSRMVKVASQERYFIDSKTNVEELSYSNRLEFTKLPNGKKKLKLVEKCIKEEMSFRTLSEVIFKINEKTRGVTPLPPLKLISNVDKLFEGTQLPALLSTPDKLENLRSTARTQMKEKANTLLNKMQALTKDCNSLITTLDDIEKKKRLEKEEQEREKEERRVKREKEKKEKKEKKEAKIKEEEQKKEKKDKEEKEKEKEK
jgi:hypothetical protein